MCSGLGGDNVKIKACRLYPWTICYSTAHQDMCSETFIRLVLYSLLRRHDVVMVDLLSSIPIGEIDRTVYRW